MGLKILHSGDWHLGAAFGGFREEQRRALVQAQKELPGRLVRLCREEGCDLVLLAGDLFDGPVGKDWVSLVKAALGDFRVPVLIAPGNHDACIPGSPWLEEAWPENVHIFRGGLSPVVIPSLDCRIYGAGYESMDCLPLLEGFRAEGQERYCLGLLHGDPVKRDSPYCPITREQVTESGFDYLALGHIHKQGQLTAGETLCGWPGCPMGRGWDETGEKGVYLVTLGEETSIRFLELDTPGFYRFSLDIGGDALSALRASLPAGGSEDYYRITLTGRGEADLKKLRLPEYPNLELESRVLPPVELWQRAEEDSLTGHYFRLLREMGDPAAKLAAELSQRLLEGEEVALP